MGRTTVRRLLMLAIRTRTILTTAIVATATAVVGAVVDSSIVVVSAQCGLLLVGLVVVLDVRRKVSGVAKVDTAKEFERLKSGLRATIRHHNKALVDAQDHQSRVLEANVLSHMDSVTSSLDQRVRELPSSIERVTNLQTAEIGAIVEISALRPPTPALAPRPALGGWAVNPTTMLELLHLVKTRKPQTILELGSGSSTVWLAHEVAGYGGSIISLDHEEQFAVKTRAWLKMQGLLDVADVRHAPLQPFGDDGTPWYSLDALSGVTAVDFLIVDGPPAKLANRMRYPALGVVRSSLTPGATIVVDDVRRKGEREIVEIWLSEHSDITHEESVFSTHAVLRLKG